MALPLQVSVVIPTRGRPASLERAMRSVFVQTGAPMDAVELVIVDNDATEGARATVERLAAEAPFPVVYACEPSPGVASARNRALVSSKAPLIAFLDDDEQASPGWLAALLEVRERFDADVVFGPVRGYAPEPIRHHRPYLERFFSREGPSEATLIEHQYGCGDSLIRRAALPPREAPFSLAQNLIGGEAGMADLLERLGVAGDQRGDGVGPLWPAARFPGGGTRPVLLQRERGFWLAWLDGLHHRITAGPGRKTDPAAACSASAAVESGLERRKPQQLPQPPRGAVEGEGSVGRLGQPFGGGPSAENHRLGHADGHPARGAERIGRMLVDAGVGGPLAIGEGAAQGVVQRQARRLGVLEYPGLRGPGEASAG